jgi:hypothetical protein
MSGLSFSRFIDALKRDARLVEEDSWSGTSAQSKALLLDSIKERAFGSMLGSIALGFLGAGIMAAIALNPLTATILTVSALFLFVFAHDFIVSGLNKGDIVANFMIIQNPTSVTEFFCSGGALVRAAFGELTSEEPYTLRDTWLLGKLFPNNETITPFLGP